MADYGNIPPPPPGYQMVGATGAQASSVPPPPPGYQMVGAQPDAPAATPADPSLLDQIRRSGAMAGRNVAQGLMSIPGIFNDPIAATLNYGEEKLGVDPKYRFGTAAQATDAALNAVGVPDAQPQNGDERIAGRINQAFGGLLGGMGVGGLLGGTTNATAQTVGGVLKAAPGAQVAATTAGSALGGIAHEAGASPKVEMAASLLGGLTPAAGEASAQGLAGVAGRLLGKPNAQTSRLAGLAQDAGIPLKASQISESRVAKLVDSATGQVPFSGATKFQASQQKAFNKAVGQTIGVNENTITPDVFARAKQTLGNQFNTLAARNDMSITPELVQKLGALRSEVVGTGNTEAQTAIDHAFSRVVAQQQNSQLPGAAYKSLHSDLGRMAANTANPDKAHFAGQMRSMLEDAMDGSISPQDAQAWSDVRRQYRDLKTIEPLVAEASANGGNISPAKLMGRVLANKAGKSAVAQGKRGQLADLAAIGQRFLKEQIPNSGTAPRQAVNDVLKGVARGAAGTAVTGAAYLNPVATGLGTAAVVGISRQVQNILKSPRLVQAVLRDPKTPDALRKALEASISPTTQGVLTQGR